MTHRSKTLVFAHNSEKNVQEQGSVSVCFLGSVTEYSCGSTNQAETVADPEFPREDANRAPTHYQANFTSLARRTPRSATEKGGQERLKLPISLTRSAPCFGLRHKRTTIKITVHVLKSLLLDCISRCHGNYIHTVCLPG